MRPVLFFLLFLLTSFLPAQTNPNEQTMARLAQELVTRLNGKKLKKVAVQRLTYNGDLQTPEGAWLADEMVFALQGAGPDFAIISREEIERKTADFAEQKARKASQSSSSNSSYEEETTYEEEYYAEEESYEETYEDPEEETYEKSGEPEQAYSKSGQEEQAEKKKKKNSGLIIGGALLAAGAAALLAGNKKPMAGVRATITGSITDQGEHLLATFRAVDRKGRVLAMVRGRFARTK